MPRLIDRWQQRVAQLRRETYALYLAYREPRVPWYAKALAAVVVAYAFSPIDLIPDFIPVLGHLDDLILVPLGIALAIRLIPAEVLAECRSRATEALAGERPRNWAAGAAIVVIWLALATLCLVVVWRSVASWC